MSDHYYYNRGEPSQSLVPNEDPPKLKDSLDVDDELYCNIASIKLPKVCTIGSLARVGVHSVDPINPFYLLSLPVNLSVKLPSFGLLGLGGDPATILALSEMGVSSQVQITLHSRKPSLMRFVTRSKQSSSPVLYRPLSLLRLSDKLI